MSENEQKPPVTPESENPIADYYEGVKQLEIQGHETGIKKARTALFVTAGLLLLGELLTAGLQNIHITPLIIGIALFEAGIFVGLALWTKTKPYTAIIVGLIIFIGFWVLAIITSDDGSGIYKGIIVKIIIISYLVSALKHAKGWEEAKKRM
jgi:hypothetical protein